MKAASPRVPDPLGGSEYIERLTDEIERGARKRTSNASTQWAERWRHREGLHSKRNSELGLPISAAPSRKDGRSSSESTNFKPRSLIAPKTFRVDPNWRSSKSSDCVNCAPLGRLEMSNLVTGGLERRTRRRRT